MSVSLEEISCFLLSGNDNCMAHLVLLFSWVPGSSGFNVTLNNLIKHQHKDDVLGLPPHLQILIFLFLVKKNDLYASYLVRNFKFNLGRIYFIFKNKQR